jgi:phage protein D
MMPLLSLLPDIFVPTFELTVNHVLLAPPIAKQILDVSVTQHLSPPDSFTFRLNDPTLNLVAATGGLFTEGSRVELSLGFVDNTKRLIVGEISALTADFPADGPIGIQVEGFDLLHRLTRGTVYRTFEGPTPGSGLPDSQVVTQIAAEMQLVPSVDTTPTRTEPRTQNNATNLAFLGELTSANGFFFWVDGDTLFFKKERPAPTTIQLERGKTLLSFSPRLSTAGQVNTVVVRGWDPIQKQSFSVQVQRSGGGAALAPTGQQQLAQGTGGKSELVVNDAPVANAQEAQAYGEALLATQQQTVVTARGSCVGNPELTVGSLLEVTGVGRFEGSYVVEQATHTLNSGGYQTSFEVRSQT